MRQSAPGSGVRHGSFFAPRPVPQAPEQTFYAAPWQEPENALPGLGADAVTLLRTDTHAGQLALGGAYPQGLALVVRARLHPDHLGDRWWEPAYGGPFDDLRFGIAWPDGNRAEAGADWQPPTARENDEAFRLMPAGGGGGGLGHEWRFWLWPLPPAGPVTVHLTWEQRGIPETAVDVDLTPFVSAADTATDLWPLPNPRAQLAWTA